MGVPTVVEKVAFVELSSKYAKTDIGYILDDDVGGSHNIMILYKAAIFRPFSVT